VGLSGEVRSVSRIDQRIGEAEKLGFEKVYISKNRKTEKTAKPKKIKIYPVQKIHDLYRSLF
jgi:DNA repair protein RadA/Sms